MQRMPELENAPLLLSVVISNFNYAEFLADAIDSALNLDWPLVEVVVVDDGSTDDSRRVIERYGARITAVFQENGGQISAYNNGFARSHGEVVIFLDSDDTLEASLMRELAPVWRPGLSKVQFQMRVIDAEGRPQDSFLPQYDVVPTPERIKRWVAATGAYPTPPGSGNAYARAFLQRIFPLAGKDRSSDSYCLAAAPYLGDVVTIVKPLVNYRVHARNDGAMSSLDKARFGRELERARTRFEYARRVAESVGLNVPDALLQRSLRLLPYRVASLRLARSEHPIENDSVRNILNDALRAFALPQGIGLPARTTLLLWIMLVAFCPPRISEQLVTWRFVARSRPRVLLRVLTSLNVLKRA